METMWKGEAEYAAIDMADKLGSMTPGEYATKNVMGIIKSNIFDAAMISYLIVTVISSLMYFRDMTIWIGAKKWNAPDTVRNTI